jgi:hypothetical protein
MAIPREADTALHHSGAGDAFGHLGQDSLRDGGPLLCSDYSNIAVKRFRAAGSARIIFIASPVVRTIAGV